MQSDYFAWLSPVVPGASPATGDSGNRATAGMSPVSPVVPGTGDNIEGTAEPTEPCTACGCSAYYRSDRGGPWRCWSCLPPARGPVALHVVPGGKVPAGDAQDVGAVLAAAVDGLDITADEIRHAMDAADLGDVAAGRIGAATVRAFSEHLLEIAHGDDGDNAA